MLVKIAPVTPASIAAIAAIIKKLVSIFRKGSVFWQTTAKKPPRHAPINRVGDNIPPDAPVPRVKQVANSFAISNIN